MARKRMIDPKFWTDDKIMDLEPLTRLLFIGIWNFADDSVVHLNNSKVLKAEIFPCDEIPIDEVQRMKDQLANLKMIEISEDRYLFRIKNWEVYQKINRPQPSKYKFSECSVNSVTPIIAKERKGNIIKDNKIKDKVIVPKPKKTSTLKPYKERVEDYFNNIPDDFRKLMEEAYPNIDIDQQLLKAKTWLLVNTHKAKKDFKRFINSWMSRAMDNAGRYNSASSEKHMLDLQEKKRHRDFLRQRELNAKMEEEAASDEEIADIAADIREKLKKVGK